jgi:hypothetical protein
MSISVISSLPLEAASAVAPRPVWEVLELPVTPDSSSLPGPLLLLMTSDDPLPTHIIVSQESIKSRSSASIRTATTLRDLPLNAGNELRPDRPDQPERRPPLLEVPLLRDDGYDPRDGHLNEPSWATGKATANEGTKRRAVRILFLAVEMN